MVEVTPIKEMTHEDWLKLRKTGIGGSDAAALCGLNPFASAIHVFQDKTRRNWIERTMNPCGREGISRIMWQSGFVRQPDSKFAVPICFIETKKIRL